MSAVFQKYCYFSLKIPCFNVYENGAQYIPKPNGNVKPNSPSM